MKPVVDGIDRIISFVVQHSGAGVSLAELGVSQAFYTSTTVWTISIFAHGVVFVAEIDRHLRLTVSKQQLSKTLFLHQMLGITITGGISIEGGGAGLSSIVLD